jgi:hypothetical protein
MPNWKLVSDKWAENVKKNQTATISKILLISVVPVGMQKGVGLPIKYLGVTV